MTAPDTPALAGMSIGAVLESLRPDFPDVTISKIRFLEAEGLVTPQRSGSGYRRFTAYDCARLRFILTAQRDHYLPLKVIKAQLDSQSDGALPETGSSYGVPRLVQVSNDGRADHGAYDTAAVAPAQVRLSREDLLSRSGVGEELLGALIKAGVVTSGPGGFFDEHMVVTAQCAKALADYGVEPRHLRAFRSAADREAGLVEQVVSPLRRQRGPEAAARAEEATRELSQLCVRLHASLVKAALERGGS